MPEAVPAVAGAKKSSVFSKPLVLGVCFAIIMVVAVVLTVTQARFKQGKVRIGDNLDVRVWVAATEATHEKGLSGKAGLAADQGMYFIFDHPDQYVFWMKDMRFPIDIIWISKGTIADITTDLPAPTAGQVELPTYGPRVPVDRVLEVQAGFAKAHGLRIGLPVTEMLGEVDSQRPLR